MDYVRKHPNGPSLSLVVVRYSNARALYSTPLRVGLYGEVRPVVRGAQAAGG